MRVERVYVGSRVHPGALAQTLVSQSGKMGSPAQDLSQPETVPILGPTPERRSCVDQDGRGGDDSGHEEFIPTSLPRPCSSVYSVDSSSFEVAADESIRPSQGAVAQRTDELGPILIARPSSVDTSFSIPILWQPSARPRSSLYSDESLSWDELTARVDESVRTSQLETIARLTREKTALQDQLLLYQRSWHEFMRLFGRILNLTLRIRDIIREYDGAITTTEEAWVARWGITWI
jgi:hypothetical protein